MARMHTLSSMSPSKAFRRTQSGEVVFDVTERRHPRFNLMEKHWRFLLESYEGGPEYLYKGIQGLQNRKPGQHLSLVDLNRVNLFQYFKEGNDEFRGRMMRARRVNYCKKIANQLRAFVARKPPVRRVESAPSNLQRFWKNADGRGRDIDRTMGLALQWSEVFGIVWACVDKSREVFETAASERDEGMPYVKFYFPFDVLDAGFDDLGRLKWILVREVRRADPDPELPSPLIDHYIAWDRRRYRAWVKNRDQRTEVNDRAPMLQVEEGIHNLGFVPFIPIRFAESDDHFVSPGLLDDIAYLDRAVFNHSSQLDTIIYDQTFSQLVMPTDGLVLNEPERMETGEGSVTVVTADRERTRRRILETGTKRVFLFNGQASHAPQYISPDATQADVVRQTIKDETDEIYRTANLLGDVGRDVRTQTGVSKAYDFDRLNKVLAFAAQELQIAEFLIAEMVLRWLKPFKIDDVTSPVTLPPDLVSYPENFDIMGLLETLDIAFRSDEYGLDSPTADRLMHEQVIRKLLPHATTEDMKKIMKDLEDAEERKREMAERLPLDPLAVPEGSSPPEDGDESQTRGRGGGARQPGDGGPRPPTRQQARGETGPRR
jgi:hypothetical protein